MPAHASTNVGGAIIKKGVTVTGNHNNVTIGTKGSGEGANKANNASDNSDDKNFSYEVFDYVEIRLKHFADQTKKIADKITDYVSWATKKNKLHEETLAIQKEIQANSRAATTYIEKANAIADEYTYTDDEGKAQTLRISDVFNLEELKRGKYDLTDMETSTAKQKAYIEAARAYIDYYDKATDASNAINDLTNTLRELYDSIIMIPSEKLDDTLEKLENVLDTFNSGMDAIATGASGISGLQKVLTPFTDLFSKKNSQGAETSTLGKVMDASTSNPAWYTQNALVLQALKKQKEEVNASQTALREQVAVTKEFTGALANDAKNLEDQGSKLLKSDQLNAEQKKAIENKWVIDSTNFSNGATVTDELAEAVSRYNRIVKAWQSHSNAVNQAQEQEVEMREQLMQKAAEYAQAEQEYVKTALENLDNYYQNIINFNKALSDSNAKQRELMQTIGRNAGSGDRYDLVGDNRASFEEQLERLYRVRQALTEDAEKQQAFLDRKLYETGELIEGSEEWKEYTTQINELKNEAIETQIEIEKLWDEMIQDVYFKPIEEAIDKIKTLRDNVQALQGLISDDMKFTDQGDYTEWGIAHLTADTNTLNSARDEIARSIQLLKQVDEAYSSGTMTAEEYLNKTKELNKSTQDAVKNADSARRSMIKTIEDRYQAEITYINKLIEARKKEIQKQKEMYSYDRQLKKSTKEIQLLEQQIRATETLTDAESRSLKARLEAQKKEAEEQLEDQVRDHIVDMRVEGLDKISEQLQENYDNYVKELATNLDMIVDTVNTTATHIGNSIDLTNHTLERLLNSFHEDLDFDHLGAEYFTVQNTDTSSSNRYDTQEIAESTLSRVYVTEQGTFTQVDKQLEQSLPVVTDKLLEVFSAGMNNMFEASLKNMEIGTSPITTSNKFDSLITINVEGNLDESVIPQIEQIGKDLLNNRNFMNGTYDYVVKAQAKDQRKAGM